ncbi:MAG: response regulator transcription factor [Methylobacteriaceae bacterium]|nr:response regulator transcription factor [Methylobacteriaceae bacterium]
MNVLIVDDHPIVISGCRSMLADETDIEVVEAADGESGYQRYLATKPAVAVIDINLPGLSGLDLLRRILRHDPAARIIIFSMNDDPIFAARAIEFGAKGFLPKSGDPARFVEALRTVAGDGVFLPPEMAQKLAFYNLSLRASPLNDLSGRELEILRLLGNGKSMADIADLIHVSYKTVANTCSILKRKLGARTAMDLVRIAAEHQLV